MCSSLLCVDSTVGVVEKLMRIAVVEVVADQEYMYCRTVERDLSLSIGRQMGKTSWRSLPKTRKVMFATLLCVIVLISCSPLS